MKKGKMDITKIFSIVLETFLYIAKETGNLQGNKADEKLSLAFFRQSALIGYSLDDTYSPQSLAKFPSLEESGGLTDIVTPFILVRNLFETYIIMYYLLIDSESEKEKEFRLNLWDRHGLSEGMEMSKLLLVNRNVIKEYERQYKVLWKKIVSSDFYKKLSEPEKKSIKKPYKWIVKKKGENIYDILYLSDIAKIHPSQAGFIYKFLSNYVHSQSFSLEHQATILKFSDTKEELDRSKFYACMFLSLILDCFCKIIPKARDLIDDNKDIKEIIEVYQELKEESLLDIEVEKNKLKKNKKVQTNKIPNPTNLA